MDKFLEDLEEFVAEPTIGTYTITDVDKGDRQAIVQRTDADEIVFTISCPSTYPKGKLVFSRIGGESHGIVNTTLAESIESALEMWAEEDVMVTGQSSSTVFDVKAPSTGTATGGIDTSLTRRSMQIFEEVVTSQIASAQLGRRVGWYVDESHKRLLLRLSVPLEEASSFLVKALNLKAGYLLVVEVSCTPELKAHSSMGVVDVFQCLPGNLSIVRDREPCLGSMKWYMEQRFRTAIRKNALRQERIDMGFGEYDKTHKVEGLQEYEYSFPEENFSLSSDGKTANTNTVLAMQRFVEYCFAKCTSVCMICFEPLGISSLKMTVCDNALCQHSVENYGIGVSVLDEVRQNPLVTELLIYMTCAAAIQGNTRDVFTPMCPATVERRAPAGYKKPVHFFSKDYLSSSKNFSLIIETVQKIPKLTFLVDKAASISTEQKLREHLDSTTDLLVYPLLQWILASNRAHLEPLDKKDLISGLGSYQFHLISSTPEKEHTFRARREEMQKKTGKGSFFVWHGSQPCNWHCILRIGLKNYSHTKLMSAGAAHGSGIYTAKTIQTSVGYMGQPTGAWSNASLIPHTKGCTLIALCEVVNDKSGYKEHGEIITVQDENIISTRFLFVFPDGFSGNTGLKAESVSIPPHLLATT